MVGRSGVLFGKVVSVVRHIVLAVCVTAMLLAGSQASACLPEPMDPQLPNESSADYKLRTDELRRQRIEQWMPQRQAQALQSAKMIFIGRDTAWSPPYRPPPPRLKQPPVPSLESISGRRHPVYFKPVAWLRGSKKTDLFAVPISSDTCGRPMGFGDVTSETKGKLYVFFASKGPVSRETLIDAIAADAVTDPALVAFVAEYRRR